jgi:hypothetical protein
MGARAPQTGKARLIRRPGEASSQYPALRHEVARAGQTTTPAENSLVHLIRRFEVLMVLARQAIEDQRLVDVLFDPAGELWIFARPFGEPGGEIAARLGEIASIVEPAQFLLAFIVDAARYVVERVSQEMHVTALVGCLCQNLAQYRSKPGVIVGHDDLDAVQTARLEPEQEIAPARAALAIGKLHRQYLASAVPVDADRDQYRLADDYALSRTRS